MIGGQARGAGVLLAAGASSRMGTPKALLRTAAGQTLLEAGCAALRRCGADPLLVVLGHQRPALEPLLPADAKVVVNPEPDRGQISSMQLGLTAAAKAGCAFALIALVDQPPVAAAVFALLMEAAQHEPAAVHVPLYRGERGHPVALPVSLAPALALAGPDEGARHVIERLGLVVREHDVPDAAVLVDLDTPEDVARWRDAEASP